MKRWNLRGLAVVGFAHGASDFYSGMVPLLIFAVVAARGLSPVYQGAVGFLWYLTSSIVQPLFGSYSDLRGKWWFLPAAVAVTVLSVSFAGIAAGIVPLALFVLLGGLGSAVMHPEAGKYAAMLSGERKSGGISIFQIGGALGYAAGPVVIGKLLALQGTHGSLWMLFPGAIAVAALFLAMRRVDSAAVRAHAQMQGAVRIAPAVDRIGVALLVAGTALKYLVGAAFMTYLPNLIVARGGTISDAGVIVTCYLGIGVAGLYVGGWLADRYGVFPISIASLLGSVPLLFAFFASPSIAAVGFLFAANVLLNVQSAPSVAIVARMLPRNLGMALGLMNGVAFGIGSALVAVVGIGVARDGAAAALMEVSLLPALCAAVYVFVWYRLRETPYAGASTSA